MTKGELIWSMYAAAHALREAGFTALADRFQAYLAGLARHAQTIFYRGNGNVSWVTQARGRR